MSRCDAIMTIDVTLTRHKYLHLAIINFPLRITIRFWNIVSNVLEDNKIACCLHFHICCVARISRHDVNILWRHQYNWRHINYLWRQNKHDWKISLIKFSITLGMTFKSLKNRENTTFWKVLVILLVLLKKNCFFELMMSHIKQTSFLYGYTQVLFQPNAKSNWW